ncbi:unnamed protein product [Polarella glacialis]|uniref:EF-hand domain-containing protein n=1 Tax=Polarella glacialis TaxID=89957 RepID=A0A813DIQ0_POLGL|nr:unnamed protein product [Polarella glacialis]
MAGRRSLAVFLALFLFVMAFSPALADDGAEDEGAEDDKVGLTEEEVTHTFESLDSDKDSKLSKAELIEWVKSEDEEIEDEDAHHEVSSAFEVYDHDKDDFFSKEEFTESLRAMEADEDEAHHEDEDAEHKVEDERPHEN